MGCMLNLIGMLPLGQLGLRLIKWDAAPWLVSLPEAAEQVGCGFGGRLSKWDGGLGDLESVQLEGQVPPRPAQVQVLLPVRLHHPRTRKMVPTS